MASLASPSRVAERPRRRRVAAALTLLALALGAGCDEMRVDPNARPDVIRDADADDALALDAPGDDDVATGPDTGPGPDAESGPDAEPGTDAGPGPDGGGACRANRDGTIERAEMPTVLGATVTYVVNRDGTTVDGVDTAGTATPDGRLWDLSAMRAEDHRVLDEVLPPTGHWWSSRYPDATFALVIDRATQLYGVYRATDSALQLLATVSRERNRTDLQMDPPVDVVRFPLREGLAWEQTVVGRGVLNYTAFQNLTRYSFRVDARGEVRAPAGRFPALRLRTELDQSVPFTAVRRTQRTYAFVSECWGLVARIASVDNETSQEFTRASEYLRLGL